MTNQELTDYIKKSKEVDQTDEQIKSALLANGWQEKDINDNLQTFTLPKKSVNKKIFLVALVVIVFLSGGFFAYYYTKNKPQSSEEINVNSWQTFSNQAIQFRYPDNWTANASEINPDGFGISFKEGSISHGVINFKVKSRIGPNSLSDYEKEWENTDKNLGNKIYNKQTIVIGGHNAIRYDSTFKNEDGLFYYGTAYIDFEDYIIHGDFYGQEKSLIDVSRAIYSSMNFLDGKAIEPKVKSSIDINTWEQFSNDYLDFRYPEDWTLRGDKAGNMFVIVSSPDKSTNVSLAFNNLSEMRKDITDWYAFNKNFNKNLEAGTISNERDIKIDNLTFKAYEVAGMLGKYTATTLVTQNYLYYFKFTPNISDNYLYNIASTIKIKQK